MSEGNNVPHGNTLFLKDETLSDACFPLFFFDDDRERAKPLLDYLTDQGIPVYQKEVFEEDKTEKLVNAIIRIRLVNAPVVLLFFGKEESGRPFELFSILENYQKKAICIYLDSLSSEQQESYQFWTKNVPVIGTYSMDEGKTDCFDEIAKKIALVYPFFQKYGPFEKVLESAKQGDPDAEYWIARRYLQDEPSTKNQKESYAWMLKAYKDGKKKANLEIAEYLIKGIGVEPDEDKALRIINAEIRKDNPKAYLVLGECFQKGDIYNKDLDKARENYLEAMKRGCFEAQTSLAQICLEEGHYEDVIETLDNSLKNGVLDSFSLLLECFDKRDSFPHLNPKVQFFYGCLGAYCGNDDCQIWMAKNLSTNPDKDGVKERCLYWLEQAASKGNAKAFYSLGKVYVEGKLVSRDLNKAFLCYQISAKKDYPKGISALGICYRDGIGVKKDEKVAFDLLTKSEEMHDFVGTYELARYYRFNRGTDEDLLKARQFYSKADEFDFLDIDEYYKTDELFPKYCVQFLELKYKAEVNHDVSALVDLGECHFYGKGTKENEEEAVRCYQTAADCGSLDGLYHLAYCYRKGYGVEKNGQKALYYYEKCMERKSIQAELDIGEMYYYGEGIIEEEEKGFGYALSSLKKGNHKAVCLVANAYLSGRGTKEDHREAFRLLWEYGDQQAEAELYLGFCYEMGYGIQQDLEQAFGHYKNAAEEGYYMAKYKLGNAYFFGKGVEQDYKLAFSYLDDIADDHFAPALYLLGRCYEEGIGKQQDIRKANAYYQQTWDFRSHQNSLCFVSRNDMKRALKRTGGINRKVHKEDLGRKRTFSLDISGHSKFIRKHIVLLSFLLEWLIPLTFSLILIPAVPVWPICLAVMIETAFFCILMFLYRKDIPVYHLPKWYSIPCFLVYVLFFAVIMLQTYSFPLIGEIARETVNSQRAGMYLDEIQLVPIISAMGCFPALAIGLINNHFDIDPDDLDFPMSACGCYFGASIVLLITDLMFGSLEVYQSYPYTEVYPGFIVRCIFFPLMVCLIVYVFSKFGRYLSNLSFSPIIDKRKKRHQSK